MSCNKEIIKLMHKYLDEELSITEEKKLRSHLQSCQGCQDHFRELTRTVALLKSSSNMQPSTSFTANVMSNLPKEKKHLSYIRWFKSHSFITAAAIFFLFMLGSIFSIWDEDGQLSVSKDHNVIINDYTVIVPEGVIIDGDLVVKNGDLKIDGAVNGNVTLINGEHLMASAGNISGEIEQVNQVFEWMWYHLKRIGKSVFDLTN
ncbi:anti-sigma-W factor RsiW [Paraliobacillus quinghaiensis]|uniref:Anti-sigma-W factor RsiW n=1 Tax=Paraliobacillus quinghaiensis TaxID=470815 RepID=A0A917TV12_9BACI|nr:anti-sigma factor [Paraliobacillus quinghaiensis]GGM39253.1 anti-sigma-W factor RsiW [Paraliobacillus quinghaiensis]